MNSEVLMKAWPVLCLLASFPFSTLQAGERGEEVARIEYHAMKTKQARLERDAAALKGPYDKAKLHVIRAQKAVDRKEAGAAALLESAQASETVALKKLEEARTAAKDHQDELDQKLHDTSAACPTCALETAKDALKTKTPDARIHRAKDAEKSDSKDSPSLSKKGSASDARSR
jgi:hypothetical protein